MAKKPHPPVREKRDPPGEWVQGGKTFPALRCNGKGFRDVEHLNQYLERIGCELYTP